MGNQTQGMFIPYTYTYDQFTVLSYDDRAFSGEESLPIEQCSMDILNLDEEILMKICQRVQDFLSIAQRLLTEKTSIAVVSAWERLNAAWDIVFTLSGYRDLQIDGERSYHALENLLTGSDKQMQVQTPGTEGYAMYQGFMEGLPSPATYIRMFQDQIVTVTEFYFEPLTRRNNAAYADAHPKFCSQMASIVAYYSNEDFDQSFSVEVNFVPMMHPTEEDRMFAAGRATFDNLLDFLQTEFYRGLAIGNASRRCHNCGRYFLLIVGYNTCYRNGIVPDGAERTCRKVGAHRRKAQNKVNRTSTQVEYNHTYNRLKQRRSRKRISIGERSIAVAKAQELMEQAGRGELMDAELKKRLELF